jgi:small subunit ribosomal protein S20
VPRIKSAKKALRQSRARYEQNRRRRSALRTAIKKVRSAPTQAEAAGAYREAVRLLDRAGRTHLIHRNAADRLKSRLAKVVAAKK